MTINERIEFLEGMINTLSIQIKALSANTEGATKPPYSVVGASKDPNIDRPIIWNNTEINASYGTQPATPKVGYNKHSHSRFSGGALIYNVIEIVDYDWGIITNKNSQSYLDELPIIKEKNSLGNSVDRIGKLDLIFNPDTLTWGCPAYEIDVKKCFLVERDNNGDIALDTRENEKKSALYNSDTNKTSIVWDELGGCWRLYCVYAPTP
jgi:hypothetical protein